MYINKFLLYIPLSIITISMLGCVSSSDSQSKGLFLFNTVQENATSSKSTTQVKKQALLLGVSDYAGDNADLGGIERDIEKMKKLFETWGFEVTTLYDKESMNIVDYLDKYANSLQKNDYFAFYYSGHGSHVADKNNDEADGEDETLVLSDGQTNTHLIDDALYAKFNAIKAKQMIFFDSCHSGTVFRNLQGTSQAKTISPDKVRKTFSKGLTVNTKGDTMSADSQYIVFSSSQDNEESLATPTGSLFTNSIYEIFSNENSYNEPFSKVEQQLRTTVLAYAKASGGTPHQPNISFSKSYTTSSTLNDFTRTKSTTSTTSSEVKLPTTPNQTQEERTLQDTMDSLISSNKISKMSLSYNKHSYKDGESIQFSLDTQGAKGYLTIFYIDSNDVTLLYPNPFVNTKTIQGRYTFPDDFSNGKFELEAYKSCRNCQEEKTVIYALLSSRPILDASAFRSNDGLKSFAKGSSESKVITRAVRIKTKGSTNTAFQAQLNKYDFFVK